MENLEHDARRREAAPSDSCTLKNTKILKNTLKRAPGAGMLVQVSRGEASMVQGASHHPLRTLVWCLIATWLWCPLGPAPARGGRRGDPSTGLPSECVGLTVYSAKTPLNTLYSAKTPLNTLYSTKTPLNSLTVTKTLKSTVRCCAPPAGCRSAGRGSTSSASAGTSRRTPGRASPGIRRPRSARGIH